MSLGKNSMSIGMRLAWAITRITGKSIKKTSSIILKIVWATFGGSKK